MFIVEGKKMVEEAISADWPIQAVIVQEEMKEENEAIFHPVSSSQIFFATEGDFKSISSLNSPEGILCIVDFPTDNLGMEWQGDTLPDGKGLLLEQIQDPGNLGTIIRTADWFGITHLICSTGTVDFLNPKVLRSSMGSIFRTKITYHEDWETLIHNNSERIWLADMEGESPQNASLNENTWILMGNEAHGVSETTRQVQNIKRISIPRKGKAESLNVGIAAGILMNELSEVRSQRSGVRGQKSDKRTESREKNP